MMWQPIETAPKDGTDEFIVVAVDIDQHNESFIECAEIVIPCQIKFNGSRGEVWRTDILRWYATHWMPLPLPPTNTPEEK